MSVDLEGGGVMEGAGAFCFFLRPRFGAWAGVNPSMLESILSGTNKRYQCGYLYDVTIAHKDLE